MPRIYTYRDARLEKLNAEALADWKNTERVKREAHAEAIEMDALRTHREIGVLGHGKQRRFYFDMPAQTNVAGAWQEARHYEGLLDDVVRAIEIAKMCGLKVGA